MAALRTLLVVDSAEAAASATRELAGARVDALSTHCAAAEFLAARGVVCTDCSALIEPAQAGDAIRAASADLDSVLRSLDETVGAAMASAGGLPRMALFHAAFKYSGQYNLAGLRRFESAVAAKLVAGDIEGVRFYHSLPTSVDPVFSFVAAARRLAQERGIELTDIAVAAAARAGRFTPAQLLGRSARLASRAPRRGLAKLRRTARRWRARDPASGAPQVLLLAHGDRSFFEDALRGRGIDLRYVGDDGLVGGSGAAHEADAQLERMKAVAADWLKANESDRRGDLERLLVAEMLRNARAWLSPLVHGNRLLQASHVAALAWDIPPVARPQLNLLVELCLRSGVPVLGRQHGASYGDQILGRIHFDSDFDRCTHFFTYGFGPTEFAAAYPAARPTCSFIPAGNAPLPQKRRASPVDIVFPISHRVPLFYFARLPEAALAERQARILEAMDARTDLRCVVKPPPDDPTHDERLQRLTHVRTVRVPWSEYLERWVPRLVVFEVASTAMLEALPLDVDIFLMLDPLFPFSAPALQMLRKRAHVFDTAEELADSIAAHGRAFLPRLRDRSYYDTYVNRGSPATVLEVVRTRARALGAESAAS
jgi:hypothetical protein